MEIGEGNVDMAAAWDGAEGAHWAEYADRYEATGPAFDQALFDALALDARSAVLEIGCGAGAMSVRVGRAGSGGSLLGVDLSSAMLARARDRAAGLAPLRFEQADAQVYPFDPETFDIAMSNFGCMFFADPIAAFTNIRRALKP